MRSNSAPLLRAIRGPILLMTLGGLFAIDYFGPYPVYRTWPVLLIVFGILKLAERVSGRDADSVGGAA